MGRAGGQKVTDKYGLESATIYKLTDRTKSVKIPPPDHFLYDATAPTTFDPAMVEEIDAAGRMSSPMTVWADPDKCILWVLDGRGRFLAVDEVNRRRKAEGREPVKPLLVLFHGDEKAAVAHVRILNYHRRIPTLSGMAVDLLALRGLGLTWKDCAKKLHQTHVEDHEQWGRRLVPLAYCIDEVRAAIDSGEIPRTLASKFGGTAGDGSGKLGRQQQLELLRKMRIERQAGARKEPPPVVSARARTRVTEALKNGETQRLSPRKREDAALVAATLARIDGDASALEAWPELASIFEEAAKPRAPGRRKKDQGEQEAAEHAAEAQ